MTRALRYRVCVNVVSERLGDEEVVLDAASGVYFQLNATGSVVWQHLKQAGASVEELVQAVRARVVSCPPGVDADVRALLEDLVHAKLVEVVPR